MVWYSTADEEPRKVAGKSRPKGKGGSPTAPNPIPVGVPVNQPHNQWYSEYGSLPHSMY